MGLDMYLNGSAYFHGLTEEMKLSQPKEHVFELGYWRKHPDLHGYIVEEFADGQDECQEINLSCEDMRQIITAINAGELPHTEGFFFGASENDDEQKADAIAIFERAIKWLNSDDPKTWRHVYYRASW